MAADLHQSLLSISSLVQTPVIQVKIGDYLFGAYEEGNPGDSKYPNYIQSLQIVKINGQVNTYSLDISYPVNDKVDPNYFEKVFASVAKTRKIEFLYGDASTPEYLYRNEEGIITRVTSHFSVDASKIDYTVTAVSQAMLGLSGNYSFPATFSKPSAVLKELLNDPFYGLKDIFTGMQNSTAVSNQNLIPENDVAVQLERKDNMSVLEYMQYLVASMTPDAGNEKVAKSSMYVLTFDDTPTGDNAGAFFKVTEVDSNVAHADAYEIDVGYPGSNYVTSFNIENDENYSIYYEYQSALHPQEYVDRIDVNGNYQSVYAPTVSSGNSQHETKEDNKSWWAKVTNYPIKASITIKGLLRPAVLMTYVKINIYMFGKKHINSGLYIVTKQIDKVDGPNGYRTELNLVRVGEG